MLRTVIAALAAFAGLCSVPAHAQFGTESSAIKKGFTFPADGPVRILVFRPDVKVGEQSTGGLNEPNADWTTAARKNIGEALDKAQVARSNEIRAMPELEGADGTLLADYRALFRAVVSSVVTHKLFAGNRLPTKKADFNWTLGDGVSRLGEAGGGDYGLFLYTYDSYGSGGRKAAQVLGLLMGAYIPAGVHIGYAGLVDLHTGELVWVNADAAMGGDVREVDGASKRVTQLLDGFPVRAAPGPTVKVIK